MRVFIKLALTALALAAPIVAKADSSILLHQSVSLPGATAEATVGPAAHGQPGYRVDLVFQFSANSPIDPECVSIYRDIRYVLRDANHRVMPLNEEAMRRPVEMEHSIGEGHSPVPGVKVLPSRAPCSNHFGGGASRHVDLLEIYPHLAPGTYTLYMSFAPRGMSQEAGFKPVRITVDAQHPI
jgi:hypothetical protein